jgi:hypothetical protein
MHGDRQNTKMTPTSTRDNSTLDDRIHKAIKDIESLPPGETFSYTKVAAKHGVVRTTLSRRHQGKTGSRTSRDVNHSYLHPQQVTELVDYLETLTTRRIPATRAMVKNFASTIAKTRVSDSWVTRFLNQNHHRLTSRWTDAMDRDRHQADSGHRYKAYFEELHGLMDLYEVEPRHTYNMDEKGFLLGVIGKSKRIFSREMWERGTVKTNMQDGNREWITCVATICADGSCVPSLLIFASQNSSLQVSWAQDIDPDKHSEHVTSSSSGWSNEDIGVDWLENVFDRYTKAKARNSWRLLILDGHVSHLTTPFFEYCIDNRILLFIYPPHATHTLQPLDVVMFRSLSHHYRLVLSNRMQDSSGFLPVKKMDFFLIFNEARTASFTKANILRAFEACGVWPKDPEPVLKKFKNLIPEPPRTPELDRIQKVTGWKQLERLYDQAF